VDDQKKQIVELEDELQLANDAKMRGEVAINKLNDEIRNLRESAQDTAAYESLEGKYKALQRQVVELQEDADKERRQRTKITTEKRKVEMDLQALQEHLEEEKK
jgi:chromosome segregation ATPase